RILVSRLCRECEKRGGDCIVALDATPVREHPAEVVLRFGAARSRGDAVKRERRHRVFRHALAMLERERLCNERRVGIALRGLRWFALRNRSRSDRKSTRLNSSHLCISYA